MIYLDNAATTLIKPAAVERAVVGAMRSMASPGRGAHPAAMRAAETVYACREEAAALFHAEDPAQVVFCMNATHALNIAIRSLAEPGCRAVLSGFEHNAVLRPLCALGAELRIAGRKLFDDEALLADWAAMLPGADLAVCTHVSNVFGYVLPVERIAALCRDAGVPLILDASQSAGILPVDMQALGAAFIGMPGHKALFGPQGTGILLCGEPGRPLLFGGAGSDSASRTMPKELPERLEAGTHNVCGIAGLLEGIRYVRSAREETILAHERSLLRLACELLSDSGAELFRGPEERQCGVLSLRAPGIDCEDLADALAGRGICVRAGLHCAPLAHESAGSFESGTVRLSFSPFVTELEIRRAAEAMQDLLKRN